MNLVDLTQLEALFAQAENSGAGASPLSSTLSSPLRSDTECGDDDGGADGGGELRLSGYSDMSNPVGVLLDNSSRLSSILDALESARD
eukprot:1140958-Prymnesium_polylepis.1